MFPNQKRKGRETAEKPVIFGREQEVATITDYLNRLGSKRNGCLVLVGAEGSGKGVILRQAVAEARERGFLVYDGRADEDADSNPYQPVFNALNLAFGEGGELVQGADQSENITVSMESMSSAFQTLSLLSSAIPNPIGFALGVGALVSRLNQYTKKQRKEKEQSGEPSGGNKTFQAVHEKLLEIHGKHKQAPLLVVIEEMQYAKETTFKLLDALVTPSFPILLLLGWSGEQGQIPATLRRVIARVQGEIVDVRPLDQAASLQVIAQIAGLERNRPFSAAILAVGQQIAHFSGGSPGLISDSIEYIVQGGDAQVFNDVESESGDLPRSSALVGALTSRYLAALSPEVYNLLEYAAVIGRRFPIDLLVNPSLNDYHSVAGGRRLLLKQLVELASRKQVVATDEKQPEMFSFTSPYIYNRLRQSVASPLARSDHREIAQSWEKLAEEQGKLQEVALDLAEHFAAAGLPERALRYYLAAGGDLFNDAAYSEAVEVYAAALTSLDRLPASRENLLVRREVLTTRSLAHESLGNTRAAIDDLAAALPLATLGLEGEESGGQKEQAKLALAEMLGHLGWLYFKLGDYASAEANYGECETIYALAGDLDGMVRVGVYRGTLLSQQRNYGAAIAALQHCLDLYAGAGITAEQISEVQANHAQQVAQATDIDRVYLELGLVHNRMRKLGEAEGYLRKALAISEAQHDTASNVQGKHYLGQCLSFQGKEEAITYLKQAQAAARDQLKDRYLQANISNTLAYAYLNLGHEQEAALTFQQSIPVLEGLGDSYGLGAAYGGLGGLYARMWKVEEAIHYLQQDLDLVNADPQPSLGLVSKLTNQIADLERLRENYTAARGNLAASREAAIHLSDPQAQSHSEGFVALTEARLNLDEGRLDEALASLAEANSKLADIPDTRAAIQTLGGTLARKRGDWRAASQFLTDNLTRLGSDGDSYELAMTYLELTRLARDADDPTRARHFAAETEKYAARLHNEPLAKLVQAEIA